MRLVSLVRVIAGNNPTLVKRFFTKYLNAKTQYNINSANIQNIDKTSYIIGFVYSAKVVILRGNAINFKIINSSREQVLQSNLISI